MIKTQLFIGAALIAGVAVGYFLKPDREPAASPSEKPKAAVRQISDKGENAELIALRAKIRELERRLAESEAATNEVAQVAETARPPAPGGDMFKGHRERMEAMKRSDPAGYTRMTNHFANARRNWASRRQGKLEILSSVDTSGMSASAKGVHDKLRNLLAARQELDDQMADENLSDAERHELFSSMRKTDDEIRRLNRQERDNLLNEVATAVGLAGDDAKDFSATIADVIEATDSGMGRHGQPPPPPPNR